MLIAFFILWLVFLGRITLEIIIIGLLISLGLDILISKLIGLDSKKGIKRFMALFKYLRYFVVLVREIVASCIKVMKIVWGKSSEIKPCLYYFSPHLKSTNKRVLLSNSITLTPGTITVFLDDDTIRVHALDKSFLDGIEECDFVKILKGVEEKYGER